jgi:hypothetical protein
MTGPSYHARTHLPGGSDPLAISGVTNWAYSGSTSSKTFPAAVTTPFGGASNGFYTNAPTVFAQGTTVFGGTAYYGIKFLTAGHYLPTACFNLQSAPAGTVQYELVQFAGGADQSGFNSGHIEVIFPAGGHVDLGNLSWSMLQSADAFTTIPTDPLIMAIANREAVNTITGGGGVMVVQLDTDGTTLN